MCGIYKITNLINGKCYIGQSVQIEKRFEQHKRNFDNKNEKTYNSKFYRAIRKYGLENFSFEILEECNQKDLNNKEIYWIKFFDSFNNGYNLTLGGENGVKVNRKELEDYFLKHSPKIKDIAKHFNITRDTASRILHSYGYASPIYISNEKEEKICQYYLSNPRYSLLDVSNEFNIDRDTASRVLKRNNIEVRKLSANSLRNDKKIIIYNIDGNFIKENSLFNVKEWLYDNKYTQDKTCRTLYKCINGEIRQAYGFIFRWYKNDYPKKILITDYWDKNGIYEFKENFKYNKK